MRLKIANFLLHFSVVFLHSFFDLLQLLDLLLEHYNMPVLFFLEQVLVKFGYHSWVFFLIFRAKETLGVFHALSGRFLPQLVVLLVYLCDVLEKLRLNLLDLFLELFLGISNCILMGFNLLLDF